jgi:hypothetical protein
MSDNPQPENTPTVVVTEIEVRKSSPEVAEVQSRAKENNSWDRYITHTTYHLLNFL